MELEEMKRINVGLMGKAYDKLKLVQDKWNCNADTAINKLIMDAKI